MPLCPYIAAYIQRHPEYEDLVAPDYRDEQRVRRRHEVVRAGQRPGEAGQCVARPVQAGHAPEHVVERLLRRGEAHEHRPVLGHRPVRHVAPEDVAEVVLVGARDVRVLRPGSSSTLSSFVRPITASCSLDRQRLPLGGLVLPLLQQQDRPAGARLAVGNEHGRRARRRGVGFSLPSMKPVRSRSCRYGQLDVSSATVATPAQLGDRVRAPRRRRRRRRCPRARARRRAASRA